LDKCVFGPLKSMWEKKLIQFGRSVMGKGPGRVTKSKFAEILGSVWSEGMKSVNIISGFTSTGVFPVDKTKFSLSDFDPIDLNEYLAEQNSISSLYNQNFISNKTPVVIEFNMESTSSTNQNIILHEEKSNPSDIVSIFSKHLIEIQSSKSTQPINKEVTPRLKTARYGEVLTGEDILNRLKEAQDKNEQKKVGTNRKRGRPSNIKCTDISEDTVEMNKLADCDNDVQDIQEIEYLTVIWSSIKVGTFLLVNFLGGHRNKTHFKYVCLVQSIDYDDGEIIVKGMKKEDSKGTEFSIDDHDICTITSEMIEAILPDPSIIIKGRKLIYKFKGFVKVYEK